MAKRSLRASPTGVTKAKSRFTSRGWTQEYLATEVGIKTRQPIWRFFTGLPIERYTFFEICTILDLDWREIALDPPADVTAEGISKVENIKDLDFETVGFDLDRLVQKVRSHRYEKVNNQCGILQLLDINRPVSILNIYTDVNILEQIASQQWLEMSEIEKIPLEDIDRYGLGKIEESRVSGMKAAEKYHKLRVLGKPGAGKTTYLKHLAVQCNLGNFAKNLVPIFITLRDFAESYKNNNQVNLLSFIHQEFLSSDISQLSAIKKLLQGGRILMLIDGMDEVLAEEEHFVLNEIRRFSEKYHKNQYVASCRTASQKLSLKGFTDVEIAPFTQAQIAAFADKWFVEFSKTNEADGRSNAVDFMEKLDLPKNWRFRRLITNPLFLHLSCSIFNRQDDFPINQAEFYKQGMDLLLGKWDESRGVERDRAYKGFLLPQKLKLLSQIALSTFEHEQYFFSQGAVEQYIGDYIQDLPNASNDPEEIQQVSKSILMSIESQHGILAERARGIFSFSYLAVQEYFTARKIVANHNLQTLGQSLNRLVDHIIDPHWREIFLLTVTMLRSADGLVQLMKQQIDAIVTDDPYLQEYLTWANQKSQDNEAETKPATSRAFYLALARAPHLAANFALASTLDQGIFLDAALENLLQECVWTESKDFAHVHSCGDLLSNTLGIVLDIGLHKSLQQLSDRLPNGDSTKAGFQDWCKNNYAAWLEQLQQAIFTHRDLSDRWKFSPSQSKILQNYYDANQLLLDCLNSNCEITANIRTDIEATLLLPQAELEIREWQ